MQGGFKPFLKALSDIFTTRVLNPKESNRLASSTLIAFNTENVWPT